MGGADHSYVCELDRFVLQGETFNSSSEKNFTKAWIQGYTDNRISGNDLNQAQSKHICQIFQIYTVLYTYIVFDRSSSEAWVWYGDDVTLREGE